MLFFKRNGSFPQHIISKSNNIKHGGFDLCLFTPKTLIFKNDSNNLPSGRKVKTFLLAWRLLTKDESVLSLVEGFKIPLLQEPKQMFPPRPQQWNKDQKELVDFEVKEMLENRPVINLKNLNKFVPYQHFKIEGLYCLKRLLQNGDYMCKIDLKDAYFSVLLSKDSRKLVRFQWEGSLYEFLCLCFKLNTAPRAFTKFLKVPMSVLRRLMIRAIIFLDDLLIFGSTMEEILVARDPVIFLLQHLGFVINFKKCVLEPI